MKNIVTALNSSTNFKSAFWLDYETGNHYFIGATYREQDINSFETLENILITSPKQRRPVLHGIIKHRASVSIQEGDLDTGALCKICSWGRCL